MSAENGKGKIVVDAIHKGFTGARGKALPVVGGISLSVAEGEFLAIVGPSGCGKSTLMNMLAGFERPDSGSVRIDGRTVTAPSPKGIVISQQGSVFPWLTVQENLMFGLNGTAHAETAQERAALADHYAAMVGLKGFENAYPHELSGGMLKRVELARAFIVKPEILYLDEPFSALDALMNLRMRNELLRILAEERHRAADHARRGGGDLHGRPHRRAVASPDGDPGHVHGGPAAPAPHRQRRGAGPARGDPGRARRVGRGRFAPYASSGG